MYLKSNINISTYFTSIKKLLFNKYKIIKFTKNKIIRKIDNIY